MKNKIKFVEQSHSLTPRGIRTLFHDKGYGQAHERIIKITKESKDKANRIVDSYTPMIKLYRQIQKDAGTIVSFYKTIQSIHGDIIKHATKENIELNDEIDTAVYNRVKNAVIGFFVQDYGIYLFLEASEEIIILSNDDHDLYGGVDFIIIHIPSGMAYFVHVTTLKEGENSIVQKGLTSTERKFIGHCALFYVKDSEGDLNFKIDEAPFFKLNHLRTSLNTWREDKNMGISIYDKEFKEELKKYKGEWKLFKSNKLLEEYKLEAEEIIAFLED